MKVVSFSIFKGGTGKTTTSVNTAAALVKKGKRVLLVDLDQQASSTRYLDLDPEKSPNLYDVFTGTKPAQLAIRKTRFTIDVLASHILLAAIEEALEPGDEVKLSDFLTPLKPSYDFILIDTPPGKAMLAFNGLAAADLIVIPASAERMAVDGVADLISHVQRIMWNKYALSHQELRILSTRTWLPYGSPASDPETCCNTGIFIPSSPSKESTRKRASTVRLSARPSERPYARTETTDALCL